MTFEYKKEFIDQNPYLVYSPDAEATESNGGGGGGIEFIPVTYNEDVYTFSISAKEIIELMKSKLCIGLLPYEDGTQTLFILYGCIITLENKISFNSMLGNTFISFEAETENDNPSYTD